MNLSKSARMVLKIGQGYQTEFYGRFNLGWFNEIVSVEDLVKFVYLIYEYSSSLGKSVPISKF